MRNFKVYLPMMMGSVPTYDDDGSVPTYDDDKDGRVKVVVGEEVEVLLDANLDEGSDYDQTQPNCNEKWVHLT